MTMIPHPTTRNQFTFSNTNRKAEEDSGDSNMTDYGKWAERIKGQYNYFGKPSNSKLGAWTRRVPSRNTDEEFKLLATKDDGGSDTPSPELWKKVVQSVDSSPVRSRGGYYREDEFRHINLSSRAQTIDKCRQEMMELVRDLPEAVYELSLRDIIESPKIGMQSQEEDVKEDSEEVKTKKEKNEGKKKGEKEEARRISRSESMDAGGGGGLFLRMSIPRIPRFLGGKKRSKKSETCTKVSPKPMLGDAEKSTDREWWSVEFGPMTSSSNSSRSTSSGGSNSSASRKLRGCYSFLPR